MGKKVVYVPLDERHCNYGYPFELGNAAGLTMVRPPETLISKIKQPADVEALWQWLYENIKDSDYAVLSLDMLVYGSLIYSRFHYMTVDEVTERLNRVKKLKSLNPKVEIHAYSLIMRISNYDNNSEEPDYWINYGTKIWSYSWLLDKRDKTGLAFEEQQKLIELEKLIPAEHLADYLNRRKINLAVNLEALQLVDNGLLDYLIFPKDDTSEYGFSTKDQNVVYRQVSRMKNLHGRVYIYPGTDEVGCTLVARIINKINHLIPKVYLSYSSTYGPGIIAKYEDRPINESIKWQVLSAGGIVIDNYLDADIVMMVNTPGKKMGEAQDQERKDYTYENFRNLEEFVQRLKYFVSLGKICIIADIAFANGAENELVELLIREGLLTRIAAYGGWNTTANTLGVVILQGVIAAYYKMQNILDFPELYRFHLQKLVKDWAMQSNVLYYFAIQRSKELGYDPYCLKEFTDQIRLEIVAKINEFLKANLTPEMLEGYRVIAKDVKLAWQRIYDFEFELEVEKGLLFPHPG